MDIGYAGRATTPEAMRMRCSDAEREPVIEQLKEAFATGRLDGDELDFRTHLAMTAKTRGELAAVTLDLVPHRTRAPEPEPPDGEDRMLAAFAHVSGYFTTFLGPLLFLIFSGRRSPYVRRHAIEALNFQLTLLLVVFVTFGFGAVLYAVTWILAGIGAIAALGAGHWRYPFTLRFIR